MKSIILSLANRLGYSIVKARDLSSSRSVYPFDASTEMRSIMDAVDGKTLTSIERQMALISAVDYIATQGIAGAFVECGVWRGGSSMAIALTLISKGQCDRELWLYDTFEGMTPPTDRDISIDGASARDLLQRDLSPDGVRCYADLDDVKANMALTGYPENHIHYIQGPVESTLPDTRPSGKIALLRLDTDWYESTKHELENLYSAVVSGGIVIVDDYGHWQGAKQAVDEFFAKEGVRPYFHRVDYTGILFVKP